MVVGSFLITGSREAGKSTLCWDILEFLKQHPVSIGGVITLQNDKKWFYLISTDVKIPFEANEKEEFIPIGQFRVHKTNLDQTIRSIQSSMDRDYLFIDEIGLLELQGRGYYPVLDEAISREYGNILVVKETILDDFFGLYPKTKTYKMIKVENRKTSSSLNLFKKHISFQSNHSSET